MPTFDKKCMDCPVFQSLSTEERQHVGKLLQAKTYAQGEVILREGKSVQMLWIITRGHCEVVKNRKNGSEQELAELEAGAVFGEMSFFHAAPHSASIRALSEVEVSCLTRAHYDELQLQFPAAASKIALNIVSVLAERLRKMDDWICELIERPESARHREEWREFRSKLYSDWQF